MGKSQSLDALWSGYHNACWIAGYSGEKFDETARRGGSCGYPWARHLERGNDQLIRAKELAANGKSELTRIRNNNGAAHLRFFMHADRTLVKRVLDGYRAYLERVAADSGRQVRTRQLELAAA